ncbi:hypothetical protein TTHERM_00095650 (macronuclear) [Tetrahymena thermophila SB210]|uniref:Uncharacterized protein n=1 Tax=Tetrahymena thermophila (strain SB210) TaxID=312017 RepID=Q234Y4_TETTS|nr:hypothetical protein TTHERM_00095650 [Tetrahymena thermophila SB210]EAR91869.3 hypothetical protein TTHERM_00095650 [Tetrahymena thermophila SB210]|eukprot:XP_001012114.3 hypothetical protein TTHERM_00095650 [Tetrahymena thermophila SB210]
MGILSFDIFSSTFQFNLFQQQKAFLCYLIYLLYQYYDNQIQPTFRSQNFVQDFTSVELSNDLFAYQYRFNLTQNLDDIQEQQNLTYLVFVPYFQYTNYTENEFIYINPIKCQNPLLDGFNCLDFSLIQNYSLIKTQGNKIWSSIYLTIYTCQDAIIQFDLQLNCANEQEIYKMINDGSNILQIKLLSKQYNIASKQIQVNYRNSFTSLNQNEFMLTDFKLQMQQTSIKQGSIFQEETKFQSPISYSQIIQNFSRKDQINLNNNPALLELVIEMDEAVQFFFIQFPTFPEILAVCNSTLALMMCVGILGRYASSQLIKQEFLLLFLQNLYQETYLKLLSNEFNSESKKQIESQSQIEQQKEKQTPFQVDQPSKVPQFQSKLKQYLDQNNFSYIQQQSESRVFNFRNEQKNNIQNKSGFNFQNMISAVSQKDKSESEGYNKSFLSSNCQSFNQLENKKPINQNRGIKQQQNEYQSQKQQIPSSSNIEIPQNIQLLCKQSALTKDYEKKQQTTDLQTYQDPCNAKIFDENQKLKVLMDRNSAQRTLFSLQQMKQPMQKIKIPQITRSEFATIQKFRKRG